MGSSAFEIFYRAPADPIVAQYMPLLSSQWPVTIILLCYLLFVLKLGKIFMEHRKPYDLKNVILVYNVCQMIYNAFMFGVGFYYIILHPAYDLRCMQPGAEDHPDKSVERWITCSYFLNKVLDLLDTVFFVLRKSYKQITVLHVYHHVLMVFGVYWWVRLCGVGGQYMMTGFFNSFVHTVMYFYYFISAMYPELKSSLWWKKYITRIQIGQFILLFMQAALVLLFNPTCEFPMSMQYLQLFQSSLMTAMFGNFYYHAYVKPKNQKQQ
ncbi:very long chain fatty acid elongase F-like [Drosophila montana]|uniref:very long chain fatty acid elongase F-like n=1 Tax=Drosophila montana TaxID=40370 RepID=UPI00313E0547